MLRHPLIAKNFRLLGPDNMVPSVTKCVCYHLMVLISTGWVYHFCELINKYGTSTNFFVFEIHRQINKFINVPKLHCLDLPTTAPKTFVVPVQKNKAGDLRVSLVRRRCGVNNGA